MVSLSKKPLILGIALLAIIATFSYRPLKTYWYSYLNNYATENFIRQTMVFNARKDQNLPAGAVVFYGDSLVQGLNVAAATPLAVNYGIGSASSRDIVGQLKSHRNIDKSSVLVLAFGINDILRQNPERVVPAYRQALEVIPGSMPVIISLIMPVSEANLGRFSITSTVKSLNQSLREICLSNSRVRCLDAGVLLTDNEGQLAAHHHVGDGLHLSAAGNEIWLKQLGFAIAEVTESIEKDAINASP